MILLLKLLLTPILVGGSTIVARRWGPSIGGWIIALPLTSGPVLAFVAVDHGAPFAATAAVGSLGGLGAIACFSVAYAATSARWGGRLPLVPLAAGALAFTLAAVALEPLLAASVWIVLFVVLALVAAAGHFIPPSGLVHVRLAHPAWDLPVRVLVATAIVLGITALAPVLGPSWSGIVATYPVFVSILAAFTHLHAGAAAARDVLRGLLAGLYGTAAFYVVVHLAVVPLGVGPAFAIAVAAALAIEALTLGRVRPGVEPEPA